MLHAPSSLPAPCAQLQAPRPEVSSQKSDVRCQMSDVSRTLPLLTSHFFLLVRCAACTQTVYQARNTYDGSGRRGVDAFVSSLVSGCRHLNSERHLCSVISVSLTPCSSFSPSAHSLHSCRSSALKFGVTCKSAGPVAARKFGRSIKS